MDRRFIKYGIVFLVFVIAGGFIFFNFSKTQPTSTVQQTIKKIVGKKIVVDLSKKTISLYNNDELQKTLNPEIDTNELALYDIPTGKYLIESLKRVNFFGESIGLKAKEIEEISNFGNQTAKVFILNNLNKESELVLDEHNLYFLRDTESSFPKIKAGAFLIADLNTNTIIYQKNSNKKLPIASLSKLATALTAIEEIDQHKNIIITEEILSAGYGNYGGLKKEDEFTAGELLYPLLLESSNDAGYALAIDYGFDNFINLMNKKVSDLGLLDTSFEEPSGLSENNISTAKDLFSLIKYLYNSKRQIIDITKLTSVNQWENNNFFAGRENYLGGKNGYTDEAIETSIALFSLPLSEFQNKDIAIILLHSQDRETDTKAILKWLNSEVFFREQLIPEQSFSEEEVQTFKKDLESISLVFTGDIMLDRDVRESVIRNANGDFSFLFQNADFIEKADIAFGNLEGPISDTGKDIGNLYSFRMHPTAINALKEIGFDIFSIANNHMGDWGKPAFEDTLFRLKNEGITFAGGGINKEEAIEPTIIEKNGIKIGFLAFSDVGPNWMKVSQNESGVLIADKNFIDIIKNASEKTDVLVTSFHFGDEYQNIHNQRQEDLAHLAADNGADIIIGHHPHVIQDIEYYSPSGNPEDESLIAYSLGNFIFDQVFSGETMEGLVLEVTISGNGKIKSVIEHKTKLNKFYQPELVK